MSNKRMPVVFSGHGSPMLALEHDEITRGLSKIGDRILREYGKPKAILAISAHWYAKGTYVQRTDAQRQIYDMYGFPKALYEFKYPVKGDVALGDRVCALLGDKVSVNNDWGIDHGTWTVLCHMFPNADIPVVQLSVDGTISNAEIYELGKQLAPLRDEGYLIFASGNTVHNLRQVDWDNPHGTDRTIAFNRAIVEAVTKRDDQTVMEYRKLPYADYAVPTPEHFLPLIYCLGAAGKDNAEVFNDVCNLGAIAMTGFLFA